MIMCVLLCYLLLCFYSHLLSTGRPISSFKNFKGKISPMFRKSIYPIFTKFGMGVYWVNSLHGIDFGEDSCIAN